MNNKLKIYACSGVAETATKKQAFVNEGTSAITNTQAMNHLLSIMNLLATEIRKLSLLNNEVIIKLNQLDIYSICFYYARLYRQNKAALIDAGKAIAYFYNQGYFESENADPSWHEQNIDNLISNIDNLIDEDKPIDTESSEFYKWFIANVVELNNEPVSGIGATVIKDFGDLNEYLYNGGTYFLYLFTPKDVTMTDAIKKKAKGQMEVYDYCRKCFCFEYGGIYGTEQDMLRYIRSGIIEDFGEQPEDVMRDGLHKGIGVLAPAVIVAIINAVVTLLMGIITLIVNYASQVAVTKYTVPKDAEYNAPDGDDFKNAVNGRNNKNNESSWIYIGAAAIAALFLFNNKKQ